MRRILSAVLLAGAPLGCSDTVSTAGEDASADVASDAPAVDLGRDTGHTDVGGTDAGGTDVGGTDVGVDVPPDRFCGMCGCDFTGRLEGRGTLTAEHCRVPDDPDAGDAAAPDPATCEIDCDRACATVTVYGSGISRPWNGGGIGGGGGPGACERASATEVTCLAFVPCGRRTQGQRDWELRGGVGEYLLRAAFLEAQSVGAFERVAAELRHHGAPDALLRGARRSAREEREHARRMASLCEARGLGDVPEGERVEGLRSLEELAVENAAEGCAGETWGALLAMHQAERAAAPDVREAMAVIAKDEARHAALSWALHRWALSSLEPAARDRVTAAHDRAWSALEATLSVDPPAEMQRYLGLPDATTALRLARSLREALTS